MDDFLFVNYSWAETCNERGTRCKITCQYISFCRVQCTTRTTQSTVRRFVQSCRRTGAPTVPGPRRPRPRRRAFLATWAPAMGTWQTFRLRKKTNKSAVQKRSRRLFVGPETSSPGTDLSGRSVSTELRADRQSRLCIYLQLYNLYKNFVTFENLHSLV